MSQKETIKELVEFAINEKKFVETNEKKMGETCFDCNKELSSSNSFQICSGAGKGYSGTCPLGKPCNVHGCIECVKQRYWNNNSCPLCFSPIIVDFGMFSPGSLDFFRDTNDKRAETLNVNPLFMRRSNSIVEDIFDFVV